MQYIVLPGHLCKCLKIEQCQRHPGMTGTAACPNIQQWKETQPSRHSGRRLQTPPRFPADLTHWIWSCCWGSQRPACCMWRACDRMPREPETWCWWRCACQGRTRSHLKRRPAPGLKVSKQTVLAFWNSASCDLENHLVVTEPSIKTRKVVIVQVHSNKTWENANIKVFVQGWNSPNTSPK